MKNIMIYIMILLTLPTNITTKETFKVGKSEYFKAEQVGDSHIVKEEDLEIILKTIYEDFRKEEIEIFPEGLQFDILSNVVGTRLGYSNHSTISYYARSDMEWKDKPLYRTTMHEMGHMFKNRYLTAEDFKKYLELRNITFEKMSENIKEMPLKYPHLTENQILYLLSTEEILAEDFRVIFSKEEFSIDTQFLWGNLTEKEEEDIREFFIEILKRERTYEQAMELLTYNLTNHYGMFGD